MLPYFQFELGRALRAARRLAADPDDLPQVFTIVESLSGGTLRRIAGGLAKSQSGRRLLAERPDIVDRLADRAALARLPDGSLGRAYLAFVERENITPEGIRAASRQGMVHQAELPPPLDYVHARMRDTHDLWHAAVGYQGDLFGEAALLGFILAQSRVAPRPGVGVLAASAPGRGAKPPVACRTPRIHAAPHGGVQRAGSPWRPRSAIASRHACSPAARPRRPDRHDHPQPPRQAQRPQRGV